MIKFVLEDRERIIYDFELAIYNTVEFFNWFYNSQEYEVVKKKDFKMVDKINSIPVGSIEFVHTFYKEVWGIEHLKPVNIPKELLGYTLRKVWYGTEKEEVTTELFCKSADKIKGFMGIINNKTMLEKGNYMFSEVVNIDSEWRCFILNGKLEGIHNYINSLGLQPDVVKIKEMVKAYKNLDSYTMDIGVNEKGTFIIEIHDFYSCGLYGFDNHNKLVQMLIASHNQKIKGQVK